MVDDNNGLSVSNYSIGDSDHESDIDHQLIDNAHGLGVVILTMMKHLKLTHDLQPPNLAKNGGNGKYITSVSKNSSFLTIVGLGLCICKKIRSDGEVSVRW